MSIESDHDLAQNKHERRVDDEGELEAVLAKILDEAFEQLQNDKKRQQVGDDETESVGELAPPRRV